MAEFLNKLKDYPWRKNIKRLLFETSIEVIIGVVLVGSVSGLLAYRNRSARAGEIPIAFSEVEQISRDFNKQGKPVPALTKFYAVNNDVPMKVFESNNIALAMGKSNQIFAHELRTRIDANFQVHPLISTYAAEMPGDAEAALGSLNKLTTAAKQLPNIDAAFAGVWGERHHDVTHIRHWTSRSCDSKGKNCHTVDHYTTVYDYTIHTYTYNAAAGQRAAQVLNAFVDSNPDLGLNERLYLAGETHAENQEAMAKSMKRELDGKTPTDDQYMKFATTWASGSNLTKYAPGIVNDYGTLKTIARDWTTAAGTAQSTQYRTFSHSDNGPREYQITHAEQQHGQSIVESTHNIVDGIVFSKTAVPELDAKIKEYVGVVLDHKQGDADKLRSEIMQLSRDIYQKNAENGFDVQPFKWLDVVLFTMLGMAVGGAIGFGVDRLLDAKKEEWYEHDEDHTNRRDDDDDFNPRRRREKRREDMDWPEPQPQPKPEPAIPPGMSEADLPRPTWTPKPPKGVEVSAPLPAPEKKAEPEAEATVPPKPVNDDKPVAQDDAPVRDGKWVKKYRDLAP